MCNLEIRKKITRAGLKYWKVAEALGMADSSFTRKLRRELSPKEKEKVCLAIARLSEEAGTDGES